MNKALTKSGRLDFFGSILSIGCAIHCLVYPILLSLSTLTVMSDATHELTELIFLAVTLSIGLWSFSSSYHLHRNYTPLILIALSLILILFSQFFLGHRYETILNILAALAIAFAHRVNQYHLRRSKTAG